MQKYAVAVIRKSIDVLLTDIATPHRMNGFDLALIVKREILRIKIPAL